MLVVTLRSETFCGGVCYRGVPAPAERVFQLLKLVMPLTGHTKGMLKPYALWFSDDSGELLFSFCCSLFVCVFLILASFLAHVNKKDKGLEV